MGLTLDATVGGATANAFCDLTTAQAIIDETPNASAWTSASSTAQTQAVVYATRLLDVLAYLGVKATVGQSLQWPRAAVLDPDYGDGDGAIAGYMVNGWGVYLPLDAIPRRIQRACVMLALEILRAGTNDVWGVDLSLEMQRESVDVLSTEYVPPWFRRAGLKRYPSVWREIAPLLARSGPLRVERA